LTSDSLSYIFKIDFKDNAKYETDLYLDGANGIGAHKMRTLAKLFTSTPLAVDNNANIQHHQQQPCLNINLFNECKNSNDILNHLVRKRINTFAY